MRPKNPPFQPTQSIEEREQALKTFITRSLDQCATGRTDAIAALARSPESPVIKALLSLSDELAARQVGALIILAGGAVAAEDETWSLSFAHGFAHEIRLTSNPRILDGHEQLVVGNQSIWYGDSMRRDPGQRDAYSVFSDKAPTVAHRGRVTFGHLWSVAQSIYRNPALASVVVTAGGVEATHISLADEGQSQDHLPTGLEAPRAALSIGETLEAWQPLTRH